MNRQLHTHNATHKDYHQGLSYEKQNQVPRDNVMGMNVDSWFNRVSVPFGHTFSASLLEPDLLLGSPYSLAY